MAAARKPASRRPVVGRPAAKKKNPVRRKIAARKAPARAAKPAGAGPRLAGVGTAAVLKATGRAWEEWLVVLDRAGAKRMPHKDIAALLARKFAVPGWWSQMVTVGYEQARGLREPHQQADGFAANVSRTVHIPLDELYAAWTEPRQRARWLPGAPLEVRHATDGKSMRMTWTAGDSTVEVQFSAKGADRSRVAVEHGKLPSATAVVRQKAYWGDALARLKALLEPA
ncbi:MAG TPA: hypothetical protein VFK48_10505 [Usitatibacter sp.]|nr:hypothetical protein [Usitatibacter sp.]